jgi:MSHA pilin protein MshD
MTTIPLSRHQTGLTLVELVISMIIISVSMVALLNAFGISTAASVDPLLRTKSMKLAQIYLDEALSKYYDDNTPQGGLPAVPSPDCSALGADGQSRADYNDVDDFHTTDDSPPVKQDGPLSGYANYRVQVTVTCVGDQFGQPSNQIKKILVSVTPPRGQPLLFASFKGNY